MKRFVTAILILFNTCPMLAQLARDHAVECYPVRGVKPLQWRLFLDKSTAQDPTLNASVKGPGEADWRPLLLEFTDSADTAPRITLPQRVCDVRLTVVRRINAAPIPADGYLRIVDADSTVAPNLHGVLIVIDSHAAEALRPEIDRYTDDLHREGWNTRRLDVNPAERWPAQLLRARIRDIVREHASIMPLTHLVLVGDLPRAYAGGFKVGTVHEPPDGHPDHGGAWVCDAYFGDLDLAPGIDAAEAWTDETVSIDDTVNAFRPENRNIPGDGKFDQSQIPSDVELAVGRIDMRDLPAFGTMDADRTREFDLLRRYFDKNHRYRTTGRTIPRRALIDDNFGAFIYDENGQHVHEAFAASAWRSFMPIVDTIIEGDWLPGGARPSLDTLRCLFSYACGGGGFEHCSFVASTADLRSQPLRATFTLLFGSYFGDVGATNNIMRAVIASDGDALVCGWSGRPHWFLHPMAAGATIGECLVIAQNNDGAYRGAVQFSLDDGALAPFRLGQRGVHIQLVGDPTLRLPGPIMDTFAVQGPLISGVVDLNANVATMERDVRILVETAASNDGPWNELLQQHVTVAQPRTEINIAGADVRAYVRARLVSSELHTGKRSWTDIPGRGVVLTASPASSVHTQYSEQLVPRTFFDLLGRMVTHSAYPSVPGMYVWHSGTASGTYAAP